MAPHTLSTTMSSFSNSTLHFFLLSHSDYAISEIISLLSIQKDNVNFCRTEKCLIILEKSTFSHVHWPYMQRSNRPAHSDHFCAAAAAAAADNIRRPERIEIFSLSTCARTFLIHTKHDWWYRCSLSIEDVNMAYKGYELCNGKSMRLIIISILWTTIWSHPPTLNSALN